MTSSQSRIHLLSAILGNLFEHYDTALFGLLSPFLAPLFFPEQDPLSALLMTYLIIPLGMLARPVGSLAFGHLSNVVGRGKALIISLFGMAFVSGSIAFCPTYEQAGFFAPLLLCVGRLLQNFFAAGEIVGGAVFLLEHTPEKQHNIMSSLYNASTVAGILLASAGVSALCFIDSVESHWRSLYLIGCLTAVFGCVLRKFQAYGPTEPEPKQYPKLPSLFKMIWQWRKAVLMIAIISGFSYATYVIALVLMNGFIPIISDMTKQQMANLNFFLLGFDLMALPVFGYLAQKYSRRNTMIISAIAAALGGIPMFMLLENATFGTVIMIRLGLVIIGVGFSATFHAWSQSLLPLQARYAIISFSYSLGSQIFGGPTASISLWLFKHTEMISSASWYWIVLAVLATCALLKIDQVEDLKLKTVSLNR